jgi:VCBS repeat-containing protein
VPVIVATTTGAVAEDGALTTNGTLAITDIDSSDNPVDFADLTPTLSDNGYGNLELTSGTWTYTLNNTHASVQALDVGESLNDTFTFTATDGSTQVVTVAINGAEDAVTLDIAINDQVATENSPFSFAVPTNSFSDVDTSDSLTYTATLADNSSLPTWLSFNAGTLTFSGTPVNADIGLIDVRVTADDGGSTMADTFRIAVNNVVIPPTAPPTITPPVTEPLPEEPVEEPVVAAPVTESAGGDNEITPPSETVETVSEEVVSNLEDQIDNLVDQVSATNSTLIHNNNADSEVNEATKKSAKINQIPAKHQGDAQQLLQQQALQDQLSNQANLSVYLDNDNDLNIEHEKQLWARMDTMQKQIQGGGNEGEQHQVETQIVLGSTASLTAGIVGWILRGGSLLASLMSTVPVLNRFDPLPILKKNNKQENVTADDGDATDPASKDGDSADKVDKLFSGNKGK